VYKRVLQIKLNNSDILDVNKFKKENSEDEPEDKSAISKGRVIFCDF